MTGDIISGRSPDDSTDATPTDLPLSNSTVAVALHRPVFPDRELTKQGGAYPSKKITSGLAYKMALPFFEATEGVNLWGSPSDSTA